MAKSKSRKVFIFPGSKGASQQQIDELKQYVDDSLAGAGAIAGVPCKIQSITDIEGGHKVTFLWDDNEGTEHTSQMNVMDGVGDASYSTANETKTGGTWIDGKPIYRKVIDVGGMPNATSKSIAHNISNIDKIVRYYGYATGNGLSTLSLPYVGSTSNQADKICVYVTPSVIGIATAQNMTDFTQGYLVMEYTKTTD